MPGYRRTFFVVRTGSSKGHATRGAVLYSRGTGRLPETTLTLNFLIVHHLTEMFNPVKIIYITSFTYIIIFSPSFFRIRVQPLSDK